MMNVENKSLVNRSRYKATVLVLIFLGAVILAAGCGSSNSSSSSSANIYATAYQQAKWGSTTSVTFPSDCTMTFTTTGLPNYTPSPYYLQPVSSQYPNAVAETPLSHMELALVPFTTSGFAGATVTINTCPTKAASTTATNLGAIGYLISGVALFNSYEATGIPALSDNVSYTFTDTTGQQLTAYFIDQCNSHASPAMMGTRTFHYHGVSSCVTSQVDTSTGPSHLIGFALDGFPVYGGRDINGNIISVSQLDSCNGITSATPEFPAGAYHYVLPLEVTNSQSSLPCYSGTVTESQMAAAKALACKMKMIRKM
jgi:YHYH protein